MESLPWDKLSRPERWEELIWPAMEELESSLPALLGAGSWVHRNVSWSDLERIGKPEEHPPAGDVWPLMYVVCHYRKAQVGIHFRASEDCVPGSKDWKIPFHAAKELPCVCYVIDPKDPASMQTVLKDICQEVEKAGKRQKSKWKCLTDPVHLGREDAWLKGSSLLREENGTWAPTERGEDVGIITLFTAGKGGKTERSLRWTPSTKKALSGTKGGVVAPLQVQFDRLEHGFACEDSHAADEVRRLAEMPLEDCFRNRSDMDMDESDLSDLQKTLGLEKGCLIRTAAAALFRRVQKAASDQEIEQLKPLMEKFALLMIPRPLTASGKDGIWFA